MVDASPDKPPLGSGGYERISEWTRRGTNHRLAAVATSASARLHFCKEIRNAQMLVMMYGQDALRGRMPVHVAGK